MSLSLFCLNSNYFHKLFSRLWRDADCLKFVYAILTISNNNVHLRILYIIIFVIQKKMLVVITHRYSGGVDVGWRLIQIHTNVIVCNNRCLRSYSQLNIYCTIVMIVVCGGELWATCYFPQIKNLQIDKTILFQTNCRHVKQKNICMSRMFI